MIKIYCDNCKCEIEDPKSIQIDVYDVGADSHHERYNLDLCPVCHVVFRKIAKRTGVAPAINPQG